MILPDVTLLLYAVARHYPQHERANDWWSATLTGPGWVGLPWVTITGFVRVVTSPQVFVEPLTTAAALDLVDHWLSRPHVLVLEPSSRHLGILRSLMVDAGAGGSQVSDAHLAAFAVDAGGEVHSPNEGFAAFAGLRWVNPLAPDSAGTPPQPQAAPAGRAVKRRTRGTQLPG